MVSDVQRNSTTTQLLQQLEVNAETHDLADDKLQRILEQLKINGRDPSGAQAIYCESGIVTLSSYAFGNYVQAVSYEALRCIANALLLQASLRQIFVDHGYAEQAIIVLDRQNSLAEFLSSRILFLLTYETKLEFTKLIDQTSLANCITKHLERHAELHLKGGQPEPQDDMALVETLKLIYNICSIWPKSAESLTRSSRPICLILRSMTIPTPTLQPPLSLLINALVYVGVADEHSDTTRVDGIEVEATVEKLIQVLDSSMKSHKPSQLETQLIPLLTVIRQAYDSASPEFQQFMKVRVLPSDSDRVVPLGQSDSVSSRLIKLTVEPGLTNLPEAVSALFFELSDKDANTFVRNVGYGHAAGYLMTHKIPIPQVVTQSLKPARNGQVPINPITGQRLDKEQPVEVPSMTQDEKEREAERLFVLFERLKATGVVDVKNPVHEAMESGRFEELSDSDDDTS